MPPAWVRRPLTVSAWLAVAVLAAALSPLLLGLAWIAGRLTGRPQVLIFARLIVAYLLAELAVLIGCGLLWLLSAGGRLMHQRRFQALHWRLLRWFARRIATVTVSLLSINVAPDSSPDATRALEGGDPVIVFSRHAGPGDSILLVDQLLSRFHRRASVVLKESWAVDPSIDLLAHRLPQALLQGGDRDDAQAQIADVASRLGDRGALLLFPEGANFTPERRRSALASLRAKGRRQAAADAQRMSNVMPPSPAGVLAALRGNPAADVIFAGHTGLGLAANPRELWRDMPTGRTLRTHMWLAHRSEIPADADEQVAWLNEWWRRIDAWIEDEQ
jgi:1-acyl-sn-glycerol-3-phosphate acyltransferase